MKKMIICATALFGAGLLCAADKKVDKPEEAALAALKAQVAADLKEPVHPGGVDGRPFWNKHSEWFMYPPAFDFEHVKDAVQYKFVALDDYHCQFSFVTNTPHAALVPIWGNLQTPGFVTVRCDALDATGRTIGVAGQRTFFKTAPYKPGTYEKGTRTFGEAALKAYDYLFNTFYIQNFLKNGKPDMSYRLNCYPSKMHSALIRAMIRYADLRKEKEADALKLARFAADYLISISQPAGTPLEFMPPTYEGKKYFTARYFDGQNMIVYPAAVGSAYIMLYKRVGDKKYLESAEKIAKTYIKTQQDNGTWFLKIWEKDGKPVCNNYANPISICEFLEALYKVTDKSEYRLTADKAFDYIEKTIMPGWRWDGQFEDVKPVKAYYNLTKHTPLSVALYLLKRYPGDKKYIALSREYLRFSEDQFICWEKPTRSDGIGFRNRKGAKTRSPGQGNYEEWITFPTVMEQYEWYVPTAASSAKLIRMYLAMYDAEKNPLDLAKARSLGDAYTRAQYDNGRVPTQWMKSYVGNIQQDWFNCYVADAEVFELMAKYLD